MFPLDTSIFETIFNQSGAPTVILKAEAPDYTVIAQNEQYSSLLKQDNLSGAKRAFELFVANPEDEYSLHSYTALVSAFETCIAKKAVVKLPPLLQINPSPDEIWLQTDVLPVLSSDNEVEYLICQTYDITKQILLKDAALAGVRREQDLTEELAATNEELRSSNEELQSSNEELRQSQEHLFESNIELENRVIDRTQALSQSETRFRAMVEQSPVPMLVTKGEAMIFEIINQPMLDLIGKDMSVLGKPWNEAMPELEGQDIITNLLHTYDSGKSWEGNEVPIMIYKTGIPVLGFYNISYRPLIENGQTVGMLQSAIDVTELVKSRLMVEELNREQQSANDELAAFNEELAAINEELNSTNDELKATQERLQDMIIGLAESDSRFRSLVEQSPIAITLLSTDDLLIDIVNNKMLEIWGKSSEIKGLPLEQAMPELIGQSFLQILQDVIRTGHPYYSTESFATIIRNGKLEEGYFNFICQPIKDENGDVNSVLQVVTEVTDQVNSRLKVEKAEELMRMAVDAAQLGSWNIDPGSKDLQYNDTLAQIFGYESEIAMTYIQAIGQVTEEYRDKIIAEIDKAIHEGGKYDFVYTQRRFNDDELIWLRSAGKVNRDENGVSSFAGVVMDITEQRLDELRKNDFIGMVSHELKTPLTSLNGYIQVLQTKAKKSDDVFSTGALDQSLKQIRRMTTMINGFLNVSRLESGKIHIEKKVFDMADLIKEMAMETTTLYSSHQFVFHPVEPTLVEADPDKIGQVINNLISNAVKYSKAGTTIQIACIQMETMTKVSVSDEGMGIEKDEIARLFERYYRVNNYNNISGFGIGLYLSAEIIERHQGKIWAESELGKGSIFYFSLPIMI